MYYEMLKHTGRLPIIGVNTFRDPDAGDELLNESIELARATEEEKQSQIKRLADFKRHHKKEAPGALERLQDVALAGDNIFDELMDTVRVCITNQQQNLEEKHASCPHCRSAPEPGKDHLADDRLDLKQQKSAQEDGDRTPPSESNMLTIGHE